jgi:hypothetical protein
MGETLDICKGYQGTVLMDLFHCTFHLVPPAELQGTQILWLFWNVYVRVCVSVIWENREGLAKTVMGRSGHVSFFFSFLFLCLSLNLKTSQNMTQTVRTDHLPWSGGGGLGFLFGVRIFFLLFYATRQIVFFLNVTLFYIVKILSLIIFFFTHPSQSIFFSKFSFRLICLAKNHAPPPFRLSDQSLNCIGCIFNFKLK